MTDRNEAAVRRYRFATFEADIHAGEVWKGGVRVAIQEQPFRLLVYLLERPDQVVTRGELRNALWSETFVDFEQSLNAAVRRLREALGDSAETPRFIETLPKRGYRFLVPVTTISASGDVHSPPHAQASRHAISLVPARRQGAWMLGLGLLAAVAGAPIAWRAWGSGDRPSEIRLSNPVQLTSGTGAEGWATWSPDARMLAYASDASGNWDIWITQLHGGPPVNRTRDHVGRDAYPSWSPDGSQIAFLTVRDGTQAVYVMSPLAGAPRKVAAPASGTPQWSPDGTELAYLVPPLSKTVEIVSVATGATRRLELPVGDQSAMNLRWSPDGRFLAFVVGAGSATLVSQVRLFRLSDGHILPVTDGLHHERDPAWASDSRSLFFVSDQIGSTDLWRRRLDAEGRPAGPPEPVTAGVGVRTAELSRDGRYVAYTTGRLIANLWRVPILGDRRATWADAQSITSEQAFIEAIDVSPDGTRLLIGSDRGGDHDVWQMSLESGELARVTADQAADWGPRWSPDGRQVAFYSYRGGNRDIWTMPTEGGPARRITDHPAQDMWPRWSPDGQRFLLVSTRGEKVGAYIATVDGRDVRLVVEDCQAPEWSPDGRALTFWRNRHLWITSVGGGPARQLTPVEIRAHRWAPDGSRIYASSRSDLLAIDPEDGRERWLTDLSGRAGNLASSPWRLMDDISTLDGMRNLPTCG